ncbi:unnamed protein product [Heterobilharzia americana]|nr:unnamed protein product [Heterobilharzia americana]
MENCFAEFCAVNNSAIGSSVFKHKDIHKVTWTSPDGHTTLKIRSTSSQSEESGDTAYLTHDQEEEQMQAGSDHSLSSARNLQSKSSRKPSRKLVIDDHSSSPTPRTGTGGQNYKRHLHLSHQDKMGDIEQHPQGNLCGRTLELCENDVEGNPHNRVRKEEEARQGMDLDGHMGADRAGRGRW